MAAILEGIIGIGTFLGSIFSLLMFIIESSVQWVSTAIDLIEGIPAYFVFLPAGSLMLLIGALFIHVVRSVLGR